MEEFIIKKNSEIDNILLDRVLEFDRTIFPSDEDYSFPDDYLKKMYAKSKDGLFVLLHNDNIVGYTNCIFLSEKAKSSYLETKDYLSLTNVGFNVGENNMYFYTLALDERYRDTNAVKTLMRAFTMWLDKEKQNGKRIKSCISEAVTGDGVKTLLAMGMIPQDIDNDGLGIYYSPDCLDNYIEKMNKNENMEGLTMAENKGIERLTTKEKTKSVIDDYDDIAREYAEEFYDDTSDDKYIDKFLQSLSGKRILDAGCGIGEDCKYVEQKGFEAIGIDLSQGMLEIAREKYPKGRFQIMDMTNITYPEDTFDGIISNCSLFHIPTELLPQTLESFKRVLKPNGKLLLILQEGNEETMVEKPYRPGVYVYMNYFSAENIEKLLREHNFKVDVFDREVAPSEFEFGDGKLVVFSSNEKALEYPSQKTKEDRDDEER